jgi:plastocyanin
MSPWASRCNDRVMGGSPKLVLIGSIAATLVLVATVGIAVALIGSSHSTNPGHSTLGSYARGHGMMGGGYGMMGGGHGPNGTLGSQATAPSGQTTTRGSDSVILNVKSDSEHGKRGPDGSWHDAFLPADFTVHAGSAVTVTVYNYDDMPHSFTSPSLGVDQTIPGGSISTPAKTTFIFTAPSKPGGYQWWCALPCDPWAMAHNGYMRGYVTVSA